MLTFKKNTSIKAIKIADINPDNYEELDGATLAYHDYSLLKAEQNLDYLLLVQPFSLGTIRDYYGFIPLSAPRGYAFVSAQLIDLSTNEMKWHYVAKIEREIAEGSSYDDDNSENGYPAITKAFTDALATAVAEINNDFYNKK